MAKTKDKKTKKKGGPGVFGKIRSGQLASLDYFKRNGWLVVIMLVAIISLIGMRYKIKTKMVEINKLTEKLEESEAEKLSSKARYMSLIRETEMRELVREKNLDLEFREQPPYEVN